MFSLKNRPLASFCFGCTAALYLLLRLPPLIGQVTLFLFPISFLLLILRRKSFRFYRIAVCPVVLILLGTATGGLISSVYQHIVIEKTISYADTAGMITFSVDRIVSADKIYAGRITEIDERKVTLSVMLSCEENLPLSIGDSITAYAQIKRPPVSENGFPTRAYLASSGCHLTAEISADTEIIHRGNHPTIINRFSLAGTFLSRRLQETVGMESGGFLAGVLLGRRGDAPPGSLCDFRRLGISHIMAVSGFHLALLITWLDLLLSRLVKKGPSRLLIEAIFTVCFALLVDMPDSVIRSGIMILSAQLADCLGETYDSMTTLSFAGFIILLFTPYAIFDIGFLLSFSATFGIITYGNYLVERYAKTDDGTLDKPKLSVRIRHRIIRPIAVTVSATLFSLPFIWQYFGQISLLSLPANLIFVPITGILMPAGILILLLDNVIPGFALPGILLGKAVDCMLRLAERLSRKGPDPLFLNSFPGVLLISFTVIAFLCYRRMRRKILNRLIRIIPFAVVITLYVSTYGFTCLPIGHRENAAIVVKEDMDCLMLSDRGETILCDMTGICSSDLLRMADLSAACFSDSSLDALLLTDFEESVISRFEAVDNAHRLSSLYIKSPESTDEEKIAAQLIQKARARHIDVISYTVINDMAEEPIFFNGFSIKVGCADNDHQKVFLSVNDNALTCLPADALGKLSAVAEQHLWKADRLFLGNGKRQSPIGTAIPVWYAETWTASKSLREELTLPASVHIVNPGTELSFAVISLS